MASDLYGTERGCGDAGGIAGPKWPQGVTAWWYHVVMSSQQESHVGIRELKEHASALIRRAAAGETITVTDRGRAVARIVPLRVGEGWWDQMVEEGRLIPARRDLIQVLQENPPPPLRPGERSPFEVLMELRADER
jgi:prevent-host-death family protein